MYIRMYINTRCRYVYIDTDIYMYIYTNRVKEHLLSRMHLFMVYWMASGALSQK
jgi:hypothetical protein